MILTACPEIMNHFWLMMAGVGLSGFVVGGLLWGGLLFLLLGPRK